MKNITDFLYESLNDWQKRVLQRAIDDDNMNGDSELVKDAVKHILYAHSRSDIVSVLDQKGILKILRDKLSTLHYALADIFNIDENGITQTGLVSSTDFLEKYNNSKLSVLLRNIKDGDKLVREIFNLQIPGRRMSGPGEVLLTLLLEDAAKQITSANVDVPIIGKEGIEVKFANVGTDKTDFRLFDSKNEILNYIRSASLDEIKNLYDPKKKGSITKIFNDCINNENNPYYKEFLLACDMIANCINLYKKSGLVIFKGKENGNDYEIIIIKDNISGTEFKELLKTKNIYFKKFSYSKDIPDITFIAK